MLWDWHPDIEEFINVKKDLARIKGANLSVCVSDRFMEAVKRDEDWPLIFPDLDDPDYDKKWDGMMESWVASGGKVKIYKTIKAKELWEMIAQAAWTSAEPGVVFMERYNKWHNNYYFNKINCVNPCGEEGLPAYGVCNLGSINLVPFGREDGSFDYQSLEKHVRVAVRFLDNVIDSDIYIFEGIKKTQLEGERRIGLGTMGLGDALIKMKIRYGSNESLKIIDKIYKLIRDTAYDTSSDLAKEKGAFPKFDPQKYTSGYFVRKLPVRELKKVKNNGVRNSVILMQAPTGSTSLMAGVTSGIEPVYEFSFIRRDRLGEHVIYHPVYDEFRSKNPGKQIPSYFVSARDLTPQDHVRVQAAIQKYVDASISKTVNAPASYSVEDVKKLYNLAYELGCKGVTFMRAGSRPGVLESLPKKKEEETKEAEGSIQIQLPSSETPLVERPPVVVGSTYRLETPVGSAFITINETKEKMPLEIFINVGKAGSDVAAMAEALGRTISASLRFRGSISSIEKAREIAHQLSGIGGRRSVGFGPNKIKSLPDAVSYALASHYGFKVNGNSHVGATSHVAGAVMAANGSAPAEQPSLEGRSDPTMASATAEAVSGQTNGNYTNGQGPDRSNVVIFQGGGADQDKAVEDSSLQMTEMAGDICPSCGVSSLVYEEGCAKCYSCGHAEC
jgi:ribonucleoside-diphosphate reductase alpha chain